MPAYNSFILPERASHTYVPTMPILVLYQHTLQRWSFDTPSVHDPVDSWTYCSTYVAFFSYLGFDTIN